MCPAERTVAGRAKACSALLRAPLPWRPAAVASVGSGIHVGLASGLGYLEDGWDWSAAGAIILLAPLWGLLALIPWTDRTPASRIGILAWAVAVAGLHPLFRDTYLEPRTALPSEPFLVWCALWTGLLYLFRRTRPFATASGLSPRQWWKLSGAALASLGLAFWARPLHGLPLYGASLYLFTGSLVFLALGFSLSLCAYLERQGAGLTNWTLRRLLGTALEVLGLVAVLASVAIAANAGNPHLTREAVATGLALSAGLACLLYAAAAEWRYHRRLYWQES